MRVYVEDRNGTDTAIGIRALLPKIKYQCSEVRPQPPFCLRKPGLKAMISRFSPSRFIQRIRSTGVERRTRTTKLRKVLGTKRMLIVYRDFHF